MRRTLTALLLSFLLLLPYSTCNAAEEVSTAVTSEEVVDTESSVEITSERLGKLLISAILCASMSAYLTWRVLTRFTTWILIQQKKEDLIDLPIYKEGDI